MLSWGWGGKSSFFFSIYVIYIKTSHILIHSKDYWGGNKTVKTIIKKHTVIGKCSAARKYTYHPSEVKTEPFRECGTAHVPSLYQILKAGISEFWPRGRNYCKQIHLKLLFLFRVSYDFRCSTDFNEMLFLFPSGSQESTRWFTPPLTGHVWGPPPPHRRDLQARALPTESWVILGSCVRTQETPHRKGSGALPRELNAKQQTFLKMVLVQSSDLQGTQHHRKARICFILVNCLTRLQL